MTTLREQLEAHAYSFGFGVFKDAQINGAFEMLDLLLPIVEAAEDLTALVQHIQDLEYLTQGGSTEHWANRALAQSTKALADLRQKLGER